jgi:probable rRNA maturation factor
MTQTPPPVECLLEDPRWEAVGLPEIAAQACVCALAALDLPAEGFEISLLGCDDARSAALNSEFRGKTAATNVLSWPDMALGADQAGQAPARPEPGRPDAPVFLGDIALAYETCAAEAGAAGIPLADHLRHLLVHGLLHLLGYDHETDQDAALMERLETLILARMGVADPYDRHATTTSDATHV